MEELNQQLVGLAQYQKMPMASICFQDLKALLNHSAKNTAGGGFIYAEMPNQRTIQIGETRQIADGDHGSNVFGIPTGPLPATVPAPGSITEYF